MKRYKHSLSHYKLATFDMGELIPVGCYEVLPGDTIQQRSSALLRVSPLLAPVMHPVIVRMHHWFVPYRLVWDGWEEFITGGPDGEGGDSGEFPYIGADSVTGFDEGSLADYLGIPPGVPSIEVSALPFRAYQLIWNEFYRDQDLQTPVVVSKASGEDTTGVTLTGHKLCSWEKDYFTAARPWPQKGPDVTLPLGTTAPVSLADDGKPLFDLGGGAEGQIETTSIGANTMRFNQNAGAAGFEIIWKNPKLQVSLEDATAVDINTVRRAFAIQRYQEARAQYGSRYTEYLRYLGVRSSDARLQRPEYLGGGKQTIAFSEVLQSSPDVDTGTSEDVGVGELKGHGISAMRSRRYRRFFEEHGVVLTLMSVRPRTMYQDGLPRMWSRRTKEDFWQKELERIGQQEVYSREVFAEADGAGGSDVFGYQDRYAEYRHIQSQVSGEFRSILDFWHLGRQFTAAPSLNGDFVRCIPSKRVNAVQTNDVLWVMVNNSIQARRMVSKSTVGRVM